MKRFRGTVRPGIAAGLALAITFHAAEGRAQQACGIWTQVDAPAGATAVTDVTALDANDAWALSSGLGTVHWDGSAWSQVALPDLSGIGSPVDLRATMSLPPAQFFAAGIVVTGTWTTEQLLLTWDGTDWDRTESVELAVNIAGAPRYGSPEAIAGVSADDLWLIGIASDMGTGSGNGLVLTVHWDGSQLTEVFTSGVGNRQNNLYAADAVAADDIWAVGEYNSTGVDYLFHGMTYHYDGSNWNVVPNPTQSIDSSHLDAVVAIASDDVWAAGNSPAGPLFIHWDGSQWSVVPGPPGVTGSVYGLAAVSSHDVWAVDYPWQVPTLGKYYHWDGATWEVVTPPVIPGATSVARHGGLTAAGDCDVWAVGSIDVGQGIEPFIERLQAGGATDAPVPEPAGLLLEVVPNPVGSRAEIRYRIQGDRLARAEIFDVRGRRIRTLAEEAGPGGVLAWDTRDDLGREAPAGVYFLRVETAEGAVLARKLTTMR